MAREIKFRAWDGYEMRFVSRLDFDNDTFDMVMRTPTQSAPQHWKLGKIKYNPLMQFTGMKDENGKEIYEGDILKIKGFKQSWKTQVRFENGGFCIDVEEQDYNITLLGFLDDEAIVEVIGNVHQTPELL